MSFMLVYIHGMPCLLQNCLDLAEPERRQSGGMVAAFLFFSESRPRQREESSRKCYNKNLHRVFESTSFAFIQPSLCTSSITPKVSGRGARSPLKFWIYEKVYFQGFNTSILCVPHNVVMLKHFKQTFLC